MVTFFNYLPGKTSLHAVCANLLGDATARFASQLLNFDENER